MLPRWRRNCRCRLGLRFSENKILGVHLPMKIRGAVLDLSTIFMSRLPRKLLGGQPFKFASRAFFRARHSPTLPVFARHLQLGTPVCLGLTTWRQPVRMRFLPGRFGGLRLSCCFHSSWERLPVPYFSVETASWPMPSALCLPNRMGTSHHLSVGQRSVTAKPPLYG